MAEIFTQQFFSSKSKADKKRISVSKAVRKAQLKQKLIDERKARSKHDFMKSIPKFRIQSSVSEAEKLAASMSENLSISQPNLDPYLSMTLLKFHFEGEAAIIGKGAHTVDELCSFECFTMSEDFWDEPPACCSDITLNQWRDLSLDERLLSFYDRTIPPAHARELTIDQINASNSELAQIWNDRPSDELLVDEAAIIDFCNRLNECCTKFAYKPVRVHVVLDAEFAQETDPCGLMSNLDIRTTLMCKALQRIKPLQNQLRMRDWVRAALLILEGLSPSPLVPSAKGDSEDIIWQWRPKQIISSADKTEKLIKIGYLSKSVVVQADIEKDAQYLRNRTALTLILNTVSPGTCRSICSTFPGMCNNFNLMILMDDYGELLEIADAKQGREGIQLIDHFKHESMRTKAKFVNLPEHLKQCFVWCPELSDSCQVVMKICSLANALGISNTTAPAALLMQAQKDLPDWFTFSCDLQPAQSEDDSEAGMSDHCYEVVKECNTIKQVVDQLTSANVLDPGDVSKCIDTIKEYSKDVVDSAVLISDTGMVTNLSFHQIATFKVRQALNDLTESLTKHPIPLADYIRCQSECSQMIDLTSQHWITVVAMNKLVVWANALKRSGLHLQQIVTAAHAFDVPSPIPVTLINKFNDLFHVINESIKYGARAVLKAMLIKATSKAGEDDDALGLVGMGLPLVASTACKSMIEDVMSATPREIKEFANRMKGALGQAVSNQLIESQAGVIGYWDEDQFDNALRSVSGLIADPERAEACRNIMKAYQRHTVDGILLAETEGNSLAVLAMEASHYTMTSANVLSAKNSFKLQHILHMDPSKADELCQKRYSIFHKMAKEQKPRVGKMGMENWSREIWTVIKEDGEPLGLRTGVVFVDIPASDYWWSNQLSSMPRAVAFSIFSHSLETIAERLGDATQAQGMSVFAARSKAKALKVLDASEFELTEEEMDKLTSQLAKRSCGLTKSMMRSYIDEHANNMQQLILADINSTSIGDQVSKIAQIIDEVHAKHHTDQKQSPKLSTELKVVSDRISECLSSSTSSVSQSEVIDPLPLIMSSVIDMNGPTNPSLIRPIPSFFELRELLHGKGKQGKLTKPHTRLLESYANHATGCRHVRYKSTASINPSWIAINKGRDHSEVTKQCNAAAFRELSRMCRPDPTTSGKASVAKLMIATSCHISLITRSLPRTADKITNISTVMATEDSNDLVPDDWEDLYSSDEDDVEVDDLDASSGESDEDDSKTIISSEHPSTQSSMLLLEDMPAGLQKLFTDRSDIQKVVKPGRDLSDTKGRLSVIEHQTSQTNISSASMHRLFKSGFRSMTSDLSQESRVIKHVKDAQKKVKSGIKAILGKLNDRLKIRLPTPSEHAQWLDTAKSIKPSGSTVKVEPSRKAKPTGGPTVSLKQFKEDFLTVKLADMHKVIVQYVKSIIHDKSQQEVIFDNLSDDQQVNGMIASMMLGCTSSLILQEFDTSSAASDAEVVDTILEITEKTLSAKWDHPCLILLRKVILLSDKKLMQIVHDEFLNKTLSAESCLQAIKTIAAETNEELVQLSNLAINWTKACEDVPPEDRTKRQTIIMMKQQKCTEELDSWLDRYKSIATCADEQVKPLTCQVMRQCRLSSLLKKKKYRSDVLGNTMPTLSSTSVNKWLIWGQMIRSVNDENDSLGQKTVEHIINNFSPLDLMTSLTCNQPESSETAARTISVMRKVLLSSAALRQAYWRSEIFKTVRQILPSGEPGTCKVKRIANTCLSVVIPCCRIKQGGSFPFMIMSTKSGTMKRNPLNADHYESSHRSDACSGIIHTNPTHAAFHSETFRHCMVACVNMWDAVMADFDQNMDDCIKQVVNMTEYIYKVRTDNSAHTSSLTSSLVFLDQSMMASSLNGQELADKVVDRPKNPASAAILTYYRDMCDFASAHPLEDKTAERNMEEKCQYGGSRRLFVHPFALRRVSYTTQCYFQNSDSYYQKRFNDTKEAMMTTMTAEASYAKKYWTISISEADKDRDMKIEEGLSSPKSVDEKNRIIAHEIEKCIRYRGKMSYFSTLACCVAGRLGESRTSDSCRYNVGYLKDLQMKVDWLSSTRALLTNFGKEASDVIAVQQQIINTVSSLTEDASILMSIPGVKNWLIAGKLDDTPRARDPTDTSSSVPAELAPAVLVLKKIIDTVINILDTILGQSESSSKILENLTGVQPNKSKLEDKELFKVNPEDVMLFIAKTTAFSKLSGSDRMKLIKDAMGGRKKEGQIAADQNLGDAVREAIGSDQTDQPGLDKDWISKASKSEPLFNLLPHLVKAGDFIRAIRTKLVDPINLLDWCMRSEMIVPGNSINHYSVSDVRICTMIGRLSCCLVILGLTDFDGCASVGGQDPIRVSTLSMAMIMSLLKQVGLVSKNGDPISEDDIPVFSRWCAQAENILNNLKGESMNEISVSLNAANDISWALVMSGAIAELICHRTCTGTSPESHLSISGGTRTQMWLAISTVAFLWSLPNDEKGINAALLMDPDRLFGRNCRPSALTDQLLDDIESKGEAGALLDWANRLRSSVSAMAISSGLRGLRSAQVFAGFTSLLCRDPSASKSEMKFAGMLDRIRSSASESRSILEEAMACIRSSSALFNRKACKQQRGGPRALDVNSYNSVMANKIVECVSEQIAGGLEGDLLVKPDAKYQVISEAERMRQKSFDTRDMVREQMEQSGKCSAGSHFVNELRDHTKWGTFLPANAQSCILTSMDSILPKQIRVLIRLIGSMQQFRTSLMPNFVKQCVADPGRIRTDQDEFNAVTDTMDLMLLMESIGRNEPTLHKVTSRYNEEMVKNNPEFEGCTTKEGGYIQATGTGQGIWHRCSTVLAVTSSYLSDEVIRDSIIKSFQNQSMMEQSAYLWKWMEYAKLPSGYKDLLAELRRDCREIAKRGGTGFVVFDGLELPDGCDTVIIPPMMMQTTRSSDDSQSNTSCHVISKSLTEGQCVMLSELINYYSMNLNVSVLSLTGQMESAKSVRSTEATQIYSTWSFRGSMPIAVDKEISGACNPLNSPTHERLVSEMCSKSVGMVKTGVSMPAVNLWYTSHAKEIIDCMPHPLRSRRTELKDIPVGCGGIPSINATLLLEGCAGLIDREKWLNWMRKTSDKDFVALSNWMNCLTILDTGFEDDDVIKFLSLPRRIPKMISRNPDLIDQRKDIQELSGLHEFMLTQQCGSEGRAFVVVKSTGTNKHKTIINMSKNFGLIQSAGMNSDVIRLKHAPLFAWRSPQIIAPAQIKKALEASVKKQPSAWMTYSKLAALPEIIIKNPSAQAKSNPRPVNVTDEMDSEIPDSEIKAESGLLISHSTFVECMEVIADSSIYISGFAGAAEKCKHHLSLDGKNPQIERSLTDLTSAVMEMQNIERNVLHSTHLRANSDGLASHLVPACKSEGLWRHVVAHRNVTVVNNMDNKCADVMLMMMNLESVVDRISHMNPQTISTDIRSTEGIIGPSSSWNDEDKGEISILLDALKSVSGEGRPAKASVQLFVPDSDTDKMSTIQAIAHIHQPGCDSLMKSVRARGGRGDISPNSLMDDLLSFCWSSWAHWKNITWRSITMNCLPQHIIMPAAHAMHISFDVFSKMSLPEALTVLGANLNRAAEAMMINSFGGINSGEVVMMEDSYESFKKVTIGSRTIWATNSCIVYSTKGRGASVVVVKDSEAECEKGMSELIRTGALSRPQSLLGKLDLRTRIGCSDSWVGTYGNEVVPFHFNHKLSGWLEVNESLGTCKLKQSPRVSKLSLAVRSLGRTDYERLMEWVRREVSLESKESKYSANLHRWVIVKELISTAPLEDRMTAEDIVTQLELTDASKNSQLGRMIASSMSNRSQGVEILPVSRFCRSEVWMALTTSVLNLWHEDQPWKFDLNKMKEALEPDQPLLPNSSDNSSSSDETQNWEDASETASAITSPRESEADTESTTSHTDDMVVDEFMRQAATHNLTELLPGWLNNWRKHQENLSSKSVLGDMLKPKNASRKIRILELILHGTIECLNSWSMTTQGIDTKLAGLIPFQQRTNGQLNQWAFVINDPGITKNCFKLAEPENQDYTDYWPSSDDFFMEGATQEVESSITAINDDIINYASSKIDEIMSRSVAMPAGMHQAPLDDISADDDDEDASTVVGELDDLLMGADESDGDNQQKMFVNGSLKSLLPNHGRMFPITQTDEDIIVDDFISHLTCPNVIRSVADITGPSDEADTLLSLTLLSSSPIAIMQNANTGSIFWDAIKSEIQLTCHSYINQLRKEASTANLESADEAALNQRLTELLAEERQLKKKLANSNAIITKAKKLQTGKATKSAATQLRSVISSHKENTEMLGQVSSKITTTKSQIKDMESARRSASMQAMAKLEEVESYLNTPEIIPPLSLCEKTPLSDMDSNDEMCHYPAIGVKLDYDTDSNIAVIMDFGKFCRLMHENFPAWIKEGKFWSMRTAALLLSGRPLEWMSE